MLLYCQNISPRLAYTAGLIGRELFYEPIELTSDKTVFLNESGPKINYSKERLGEAEFFIQCYSLLFESGIREQDIHCTVFDELPIFFRTEGDYAFDIFAATFYLVSRYEEWLPFQPDQYGRFPHEQSLAYREQFLDIPLVNCWLEQFKKALRDRFPALLFRIKDFKFIPSYDIDIAYSYKYKGMWRNLGGFMRSGLKRNWDQLFDRWDVLFNRKKDPFDTYEWLDSLHLYCRTRAYYFFLMAARTGRLDKNISPRKKAMQDLIAYHASGYTVGIHPSWQSGDDEQLLWKEINALEAIIEKPVHYSRQHYIRLNLPSTYRRLIDAGIEKDFSMGYGGANGFRASIASSFPWYDLEMENETRLTLFPFCFMDACSHYEQGQSPSAAHIELMNYYRKIRKVNGVMVTIWHNQFFGADPEFAGWKEVYEVFLKDEIYWDM
ncbi:MAG TPA: polysaccharide deacetylase family protein [Puia sp.]|nr:polysaccharide deacetylase family protein [Puia sp.]